MFECKVNVGKMCFSLVYEKKTSKQNDYLKIINNKVDSRAIQLDKPMGDLFCLCGFWCAAFHQRSNIFDTLCTQCTLEFVLIHFDRTFYENEEKPKKKQMPIQ